MRFEPDERADGAEAIDGLGGALRSGTPPSALAAVKPAALAVSSPLTAWQETPLLHSMLRYYAEEVRCACKHSKTARSRASGVAD